MADEMLVQLSYAIGVDKPISIFVDTYGRSHVNLTDGEIAEKVKQLFDLRPAAIERDLELRNPIYEETASYGHMGREPRRVTKTFRSFGQPDKKMNVELFTWENSTWLRKSSRLSVCNDFAELIYTKKAPYPFLCQRGMEGIRGFCSLHKL